MKKVLIIGGGVSGLTAGIYLQSNGYETEIIEKNAICGGACIGWERKGSYIDGCIHWMTGVNPKMSLHKLWRDTHALTDETEIFYQNDLYRFDYDDGKGFTFWADTDKLEAELLAFAPEDKKEIVRFCRLIRRFQRIEGPASKPVDLMSLGELLKIAFTMSGDYYWINKTSKISCVDYAKRFKNKYLRDAIINYMAPNYNFMSFLYMQGHISARDGGIPIGGSLAMSRRITERYLSLGGKIRVGTEVSRVIIDGNTARGVELKSGEALHADWIVSTTPAEHCLKSLLEGKYKVKKLDKRLEDMKTYPIYTYTLAVLRISEDTSDKPLSLVTCTDNPIKLDRDYGAVTFRNYSYDKTLKAPEGTSIIQATLLGDDNMYFWWKSTKENGTYKQEKQRIGDELLELAKKAYPDLADKIEVIDVVTPCTYERYLNSRHGSFQGFVHTDKGKSLMQKGVIKGLNGFILAGQCLIQSGGLPPAVMTGRFSAMRICKADKKKFIEF